MRDWLPVPAVQLDDTNTETGCYRLGDDAANAEWSLYDSGDSSAGVVVTYVGGDDFWCDKIDNVAAKRSFSIRMICANKYYLPTETKIVEYIKCAYRITLSSIYGCPLECGIGEREVCNGHGVCGFDVDLKRARCFCNTNYWGDECQNVGSRKTSVDSMTFITIGLTLFLLILLIIMYIIYIIRVLIWKKVSSLRLDKTVYTQNTEGVRTTAKYEKL